MPDGELNVTLGVLSLSSDAEPSGDIVRAVLADISLSSEGLVLLYGALATALDAVTSVASGGVEITGELAITLGGVSAETFGTSLNGTTAPYEDILSWTGHPATGSLVRVRTGNLVGIFGEPNEFGLFAGEGWDPNSGAVPLASSQYIRLGSITNEFHNVPINLYDDGVITMQMEPDAPSFAMGDPIPSGYGTGIGLWQGKDTDDTYKWRVGDPSVGGSMLSWNGSALSLVNSSLDISGATAHLAFGNPPPTSATAGTGIWIDRTGFYGISDDVTQIFIDTIDGVLYIEGGTEFGANPILGNLSIVGNLNMLGGTIQIGSIDPRMELTDESMIGYTLAGSKWYVLALDIRGQYGIAVDDDALFTSGIGIGDSTATNDYMLFYDGMLTIKGALTAGNNNVFIDKDGITIVQSETFTTLIQYGEGKDDINFTISGSIGTDNVTGDIFVYGNDINIGGDKIVDAETDLTLRSVSDALARSTLKASDEAESIVATVIAQADDTKSSVLIDADEVLINGSKVQSASVAGGIPVADGTGKIDPSWLPDEEEPPAETGEYTVPVGAAILWGGATVPDANWEFVTELDGYFIMGDSTTDITTIYGAATHDHTNPSALSSGGHNNHTIHVSQSSNAIPSAISISDDVTVYIVGAHTHSGTGTNESVAGAHEHAATTLNSADNLPLYRRLRWIRPHTTEQIAPIGAIVMQATGATLGSDWHVCDGNGTYDMTDRFIYSGGSGGDITGGSHTHAHTSDGIDDEAGEHYHTIDVQSQTQIYNATTFSDGYADAMGQHKHGKTGAASLASGTHEHTVETSGSASSKPPRIVLQFWQRIDDSEEDYFPIGTVMLWPNTSPTLPETWRDFTQAHGYIPKGPAYGEYIGSVHGTAYTGDDHYHAAGAIGTSASHAHGAEGVGNGSEFTYSTATKSRANTRQTAGTTVTMATTHSHTAEFYLEAVGGHTHALSNANTSASSALPLTKRIVYIVRESIGGTPQTYIKSVDTPTDHAIVRFNGTTGDLVQDSFATIDDSGDMVVDGTIKDGDGNEYGRPVFLTTPKTSASWDGDSFSTTSKTLIDLSSVFGVPAGVSAIIANVRINDSGSGSNATAFILSPNDTNYSGATNWATGLTNDYYSEQMMIVPCDTNGDIYYQILASGTDTMDVIMQIWGYWL